MHPILEKSREGLQKSGEKLKSGHQRAASAAGRLDRSYLAWGGLALAAITFLAVNLIGANAFRSAKLDLTSDGLYTMSEGTRKALASIDEPIDIKVYFSKRLGEVAPTYARNFERVRALLDQYSAISGGKLQVSYLDPEPFSDAEDRAVAAGLRGIRLNQDGETGYFGMVGTNSTDSDASIGFFTPSRERFLEYDVTKLVYTLANPKKRVVGLYSTLPVEGGLDPVMGMRGQPRPPQLVMEQIREFFDIKPLDKDFKTIPSDIDVVMLVQPQGLNSQSIYAIDQFALKGGKVIAFVDPVAESFQRGPMGMAGPGDLGEFDKVLKAWGVAYDPGKVAADITHARRVQFGGQLGGTVTEYVGWLSLDKSNLDQKDVLSGGVERLNVASAGFLAALDKATTSFQPIVSTSLDAMQIGAEQVGANPDPVGLLRTYKREGKALALAARVTGEASSAFAEGPPKPPATPDGKDGDPAKANGVDAAKSDQEKADKEKAAREAAEKAKADQTAYEAAKAGHVAKGRINAVIVADTDLLADQFWVDVRNFLGQQVAVPHANNAAFVVGAIENMTGSDALISLRGRGVADRPFELVERIRRDAERRFREKEQSLTQKLKEVEGELAKLEKPGEGQSVVLGEKERALVDKFRAELLAVRRELRDVKLALRQDIDSLDGWLKFANIGLVPLLIGAGGVGWSLWRRRRQPAA